MKFYFQKCLAIFEIFENKIIQKLLRIRYVIAGCDLLFT